MQTQQTMWPHDYSESKYNRKRKIRIVMWLQCNIAFWEFTIFLHWKQCVTIWLKPLTAVCHKIAAEIGFSRLFPHCGIQSTCLLCIQSIQSIQLSLYTNLITARVDQLFALLHRSLFWSFSQNINKVDTLTLCWFCLAWYVYKSVYEFFFTIFQGLR